MVNYDKLSLIIFASNKKKIAISQVSEKKKKRKKKKRKETKRKNKNKIIIKLIKIKFTCSV